MVSLQVDGINLREATHEEAVEVIRKAKSPVCFLVQSLVDPSQVNLAKLFTESHSICFQVVQKPPATKNITWHNHCHT